MSATFEFASLTRDRLRIAMVVPPYFDIPPKAYGGVEAVVADLVDALVERGHEVTLLGAGVNGTAGRMVSLWDRVQSDRLGDPFPEILHALKVRRALEGLSALEGFDLVHDHTFAGPLNMPMYRELGMPTVITVHGPVNGEPYLYYSELGEDAQLVAISDRQRSLAPDLNWVGRVHNALRVDDWPFRAEKDDYALFLGRFTEDKAPHLALEAAHAADIPLVLAGKCAEPPELRYFESAVRPLLTERDHMFGMADAVAKRELLAGARALLFPVRWEEPFGMVMIEAMVCGTPVVALRGGAVAEVIVDGVTGRICDDPAELATAIKEVQTYDPHAMRAHVVEHFGADTLGRGYEEIYRRVVRAHRPRRAAALHARSANSVHQSATAPPRPASVGAAVGAGLGVDIIERESVSERRGSGRVERR
ncbi:MULTISPECIES: glycosyltransferase family 4 protein [unclassified Nocardia]|uniref:glycosyltransferase family 4 protein n=1 Tax=unclassified Nocardia TaxID=2637762 RepID=UPI0035DC29C4